MGSAVATSERAARQDTASLRIGRLGGAVSAKAGAFMAWVIGHPLLENRALLESLDINCRSVPSFKRGLRQKRGHGPYPACLTTQTIARPATADRIPTMRIRSLGLWAASYIARRMPSGKA